MIVYEQGNPLQDNFIIAKSGVMRVTEDKRYLEFNLRDGWRYQERGDQYARTKLNLSGLVLKNIKRI